MNKTDEIVKSQYYPGYVLASAGTGKTELIARKVEHLILNEGVDIEDIALITFTNKSTNETLERIRKKIYTAWQEGNEKLRAQVDKLNIAKISTIHGFCERILREYGLEIGLAPTFKITTSTLEKDKLANQVIEENYNEEILESLPIFKLAKLLEKMQEDASNKGIEINLKECIAVTFWDKLRNYVSKIYPIYESKLERSKFKNGIITANDLIKYAVKVLENKLLGKAIAGELKYVFLDEAQDINYDQKKLMELLIDYGVNVFIVGDGKQSIYGFRGSDKNAFMQLVDKIAQMNGEEYKLEINYRTNKFIIDKVNNLFSREFKYNNQTLEFVNQKLEPSGFIEDGAKSIEMAYGKSLEAILKEMAQLYTKDKSIRYNEVAVLCRTNKEALAAYNDIKKAQLPVNLFVNKSIYKTKPIIDFCKVLNYIVGGGQLEKYELFYTDFYLSAIKQGISEEDFYKTIETAIAVFKQDGIVSAMSCSMDSTRIIWYYESMKDNQSIINIARLLDIVRELSDEGMTCMEIVKYLNVMILTEQEEPQPKTYVNNDSITVSTIHMFKGLDSHAIIVLGIDNNLIKSHFADFYYCNNDISFNKEELLPSNDNIQSDPKFEESKDKVIIANLEEELRTMYVMMTRAKNKLILSSRKPLDKVLYQIKQNKQYASFMRWILNK